MTNKPGQGSAGETMTDDAALNAEDPFATFTEWGEAADDRAYRDL